MRRVVAFVALLGWAFVARDARAEQCLGSANEFNDFMQTQAASAESVTLSFTVTGVNLDDYSNGKGWLAELGDSRCAAGPGVASLKVYGSSSPLNTAHPPGTMKLEYGSWCCAAPVCPAELWAEPMPGPAIFSQASQVCSVVEGVTPSAVSYDIQCDGGTLYHADGPNTDSMTIDQAAVLSEVTGGHAMNATASDVSICFTLGTPGSGGSGGGGGSDGGSSCATSPISAALSPTSGSGSMQIFSVDYSHCDGASAFRVVQAWIVDQIDAAAPGVSVGYEAGMLYGAGSTEQCAPGDAKVLSGPYGKLDCANTTVTTNGNDLSVNWAIELDPTAFAGTHGVWVDAKGGSTTPEPRLGWTKLGDFTVAPGGTGWPDGGGGAINATGGSGGGISGNDGAGTTPADDGGCGCRLARHQSSELLLVVLGAIALGLRRRKFGPASATGRARLPECAQSPLQSPLQEGGGGEPKPAHWAD